MSKARIVPQRSLRIEPVFWLKLPQQDTLKLQQQYHNQSVNCIRNSIYNSFSYVIMNLLLSIRKTVPFMRCHAKAIIAVNTCVQRSCFWLNIIFQ